MSSHRPSRDLPSLALKNLLYASDNRLSWQARRRPAACGTAVLRGAPLAQRPKPGRAQLSDDVLRIAVFGRQ